MSNLKQLPFRIIYLAVVGMILVGCDSNSSGSKETQQLNNDNDPTNIETPRTQNNTQMDNFGDMDDDGEFVVIQNFEEREWAKFREDRKLESISNSSINNNTARNLGAESWKSWEGHQYRIVYFTEDGSLKARTLLKTRDNRELQVSNRTLDSLNVQGLRDEIQRNVRDISTNYKRSN